MLFFFCVGAGLTTLMSIFDELARYFFRRKVEKARSMKEEMGGMVFFSRQSWHFSFMDNMIKVVFSVCTLNWRVNNYVSHQGKGVNRRNENFINIYFVAFGITLIY